MRSAQPGFISNLLHATTGSRATMLEAVRRNVARHATLSDAEFRRFTSVLHHRHLGKRTSLLAPGDRCSFEGYVASGCLRVYHTDPDGTDHVLYFAPEDWWVADVGGLLAETPAFLGIDALEPSDVLLIDRADKERLYAEVPKFERVFRVMAQQAVSALQRRIIAMMRQTADVRYLDFKQRYPDLETRVAQHQIAAYLGISPEFLSRIRNRQGAAVGTGR